MSISLFKINLPDDTPITKGVHPDLVVPQTEDVKLFRMPGGEWHITGPWMDGHQMAYVQGATADDLVALAIWADAVRRDRGIPYIIMPYLPGARQDRRLCGEALSAKVYADMINACGASRVVVFDPHSDVMPSHINNCVIVPLSGQIVAHGLILNSLERDIAGIIVPDAGAVKRATKVAADLKAPIFQALKHRNMATGKLSHFSCEELPSTGRFLVVDDICDGGGTFKGLAGVLKSKDGVIPKERLALWVSHGIFSGEADKLGDFYGAIYTTDSHPGSSQYTHLVRVAQGAHNREFILPILPLLTPYLSSI